MKRETTPERLERLEKLLEWITPDRPGNLFYERTHEMYSSDCVCSQTIADELKALELL